MEYVKPPEPFAFEEPNAPQRWARWQKQFVTYFIAAELSEKSKAVQVARLLNAAGPEAQEIHELFTFAENEDREDYALILRKFEEYCRPKKNVIYERFRFWSRWQKEGEPFDHWVKELRLMAKDCEFQEEENMIRDQIVYHVFDKTVQGRMLRNTELKLKDACDICRAAESSQNQLDEMRKRETPVTPVNEVDSKVQCFKCKEFGHIASNCPKGSQPAQENKSQCFNCSGYGHMSRDCPSGDSYSRGRRRPRRRGRGRGGRGGRGGHQTDEIQDSADFVEEFSSLSLASIQVNTVDEPSNQRFVKFKFHDPSKRRFSEKALKVDSGAAANVIPVPEYRMMYPDRFDKKGFPLKQYVKKSNRRLEAYGGAEVPMLGTVNLPCQFGNKKFMCRFYLCDTKGTMLLGLPTCEALGIVKINTEAHCSESIDINAMMDTSHVSDSAQIEKSKQYIASDMPIEERPPIKDKADLLAMYPECFEDKGKHFLDFEYNIKIDPTVEPKVHPPRRVPFELKSKLEAKLKEMEQKGVITRVPEPTRWVNSMVVETKANGDVRVCLDPTDLNKAVLREYHPIPIVDEIVPELNGSDLFTKLDLKDGYWHVKLDKDSSYLTTFSTPYGKFRYERLPFGLCVSQDIFQYKVDETYGKCEGTIGISDDITCHGKGNREHDCRLHAAMERTREANLCLNFEKVTVKQPSVKFFGNIYSSEGVKADPDKVKAIAEMRPPETKGEIKSFLGMVNYLQKFIPRLSEHTSLLRSLERKGVHFTWSAQHQQSFENIKDLVRNCMMLSYYDRKKEVTLQCDYSEKGLGVALVQEGRPVQFASKALIDDENDFAPIEGEMLGVVYGIQKFHHYLYGRRFTVECDHKPLSQISRKNLSLAPPRLRGMLRSVADYDFVLRHRPGREMVLPDAFSRLSQSDKSKVNKTAIRIQSLVDISVSRLKRLQQETATDAVLQKIVKLVHRGWPASIKSLDPDLRKYWGLHDDISVLDGLVLAGSRIIIPETSRAQVPQLIHEGQGEVCISKLKMFLEDVGYVGNSNGGC